MEDPFNCTNERTNRQRYDPAAEEAPDSVNWPGMR